MSEKAICGNEDAHPHKPRRQAIAKLTWPDGRFQPAYACGSCVRWAIRTYVLSDIYDGTRHPVTIEPVRTDG